MRIVAIGGGEISRSGFPVETTAIDQEIIKLTKKEQPSLLFIPTASSDAESYIEVVHEHFGQRLSCKVDVLYLVNPDQRLTTEEIEEKILNTDIIYVGGGNTLKMMTLWRQLGIDQLLKKADQKGVVLSGLSAGAICWFEYGSSDSQRFEDPTADLTKVEGLGLIPALYCPHYDVEKDRRKDLKKMMKTSSGIALAFDNCCAIEIVDDQYRIITSKPGAQAYKVYWQQGEFYEEVIEQTQNFNPLGQLLTKKPPVE